jgi:16S rRNA (guanine527-N7)-methyltransferase
VNTNLQTELPSAKGAVEAAAKTLGLTLSSEQATQFDLYLNLLLRWNRIYNLTAIRDHSEMITHHLNDCLAVIPAISLIAGKDTQLLDVGSGAGLPGLVVAIACPQLRVTCLDTVGKKVAFQQQVITTLGLKNAQAIQDRVERWEPGTAYGIIICRAYSAISKFLDDTRKLGNQHTYWLAMKGPEGLKERLEIPASFQLSSCTELEVPGLDEQRYLLTLSRQAESGSTSTQILTP